MLQPLARVISSFSICSLLKRTVLKSPRSNLRPGLLQALLEFLSKVVSRERKNKMNLWAVATIMAPNLFLHKAVPSRLTEGTEKGQAEKAADVMRLLIRYQDLLWTVGIIDRRSLNTVKWLRDKFLLLERAFYQIQCPAGSWCFSLQIPNFLMSQVRKLNENSNRRYQFYDRRIKNLLRKIHTDSREKPDKNSSEVSVRDPAAQTRWDLGKKQRLSRC